MERRYFFLSVLAIGAFLFNATADEAEKHEKATIVKEGDKAPDFACATIDGEKFSLKGNKGKVVFINLFATWCGDCQRELPHLQKEIYSRFKDNKDFKLIVVGREHTVEELKVFRKEKGLDLPFAPDPKKLIYDQYADKYVPRNLIIGRDGVVIYSEVGFDDQQLKRLIATIESELSKPGPADSSAPK